MRTLLIASLLGLGLFTNTALAAEIGQWQSLHKDKDGETFVNVLAVIYIGENRATKIMRNFHKPTSEGYKSIVWHVEFECKGQERYRLTTRPVLMDGEMGTGGWKTEEYDDFRWKPLPGGLIDAQWFACAMAP